MRSIRVYPRLRVCLGLSFVMMSGVFAVLLIADAAKGRLTWEKGQLAGKVICVTGAGLGLLIYGIGWISATTVSDEGLHGPSMWGRRKTISWNDIGSVRRTVVKGVPYLLIRSRSSNNEIWLCVLGFNEKLIVARLRQFIPASHPDKL